MLIEKKNVLKHEDVMMVLEKYKIAEIDFLPAKRELQQLIKADTAYTWGYFPQLNPNEQEYPLCIRLAKDLENKFIGELAHLERNFKLAFIRYASQKPVSAFGGLHIDVDDGILHKRDEAIDKNKEIVRLLLNAGEYPRILEYVPLDRKMLKTKGIIISKEKYNTLKREGLPIERIEIPAREKGWIWALKFWSSMIPHSGITDERGHFLVAYGMFADKDIYKL